MAGRQVVYELRYRTESVVAGSKRVDASLKKTDTQFKKTGKEVDKLRGKTKKLTDAQKKSGAGFAAGTKQTKAAGAQMNKLGSTIGSVNGMVAGLGITFGGLMIANMIKGWTKAALEFEKQTNKVHTSLVMLGSEDVISRGTLDSIFLLAAAATGVEGGTATATAAFDAMVTSEWEVEEATRDLIPMLNFINVSGMDAGKAVNFAAKAQTIFGKNTGDTTEVLGMMFDSVERGHLEVDDLSNSIDKGGLKAKRAGANYEQFLIVNREISRVRGGNAMLYEQAAVFDLLTGSTTESTKVLRELNIENATFVEKLEALEKAENDGSDALDRLTANNNTQKKMVLDMIKLLPMLANEQDELSGALDRYNKALEDYTTSNEAKLNRMGAAWDSTKIIVGDAVVAIYDTVSTNIDRVNKVLGGSSNVVLKYGDDFLRVWAAIFSVGYSELFGVGKVITDRGKEIEDARKALAEIEKASGGGGVSRWLTGETAWGTAEDKAKPTTPTGGAPAKPLTDDATEAVDKYSKGMEEVYKRIAYWQGRRLDDMTQASTARLDAEDEAEQAIQDKREANAKIMGDMAGDTVVAALTGGDVLGALKSTFYDKLGSMVSWVFSMIPGVGGLFSFLPFAEGGVFDDKVYQAQRGRIFRSRPGGYLVNLGEAGQTEAVIPKSPYGKEIADKSVIPWFYPELMTAQRGAVYGGGNGGQSPVVNVEVPILVSQLDPQRITAARTVKEASYARARTQG